MNQWRIYSSDCVSFVCFFLELGYLVIYVVKEAFYVLK